VRDEIEKFTAAKLQPLGVNPASVESHKSYAEKFKFNFPLLSDSERTIAGSYNALKDDGKGIQRTVYVIGTDGTVRFAQRGTPAVADIVAAVNGAGSAR
jgi:peroxiredoxin Q/BCP